MRFSCTTLALLAVIAIPAAARADNFTITGGGNTLTFSLPASPTPTAAYPDEIFDLDNVPVVFDGVSTTDTIGFFTADAGGGFGDDFFGAPFGGQYFSGSTANPTFLPGTYTFTDGDGDNVGTLTISAGVTPEPSSLFLFGSGALGLAGVARRRITRA